jgi:hypothetical protein
MMGTWKQTTFFGAARFEPSKLGEVSHGFKSVSKIVLTQSSKTTHQMFNQEKLSESIAFVVVKQLPAKLFCNHGKYVELEND